MFAAACRIRRPHSRAQLGDIHHPAAVNAAPDTKKPQQTSGKKVGKNAPSLTGFLHNDQSARL